MVDNKELPISMAVDISYFSQEVQEWFYEYYRANKGFKPAQIKVLKELQNIESRSSRGSADPGRILRKGDSL